MLEILEPILISTLTSSLPGAYNPFSNVPNTYKNKNIPQIYIIIIFYVSKKKLITNLILNIQILTLTKLENYMNLILYG